MFSILFLIKFPSEKTHFVTNNVRALTRRYLYNVKSTPFICSLQSGDGNRSDEVKWKELTFKYIQTNNCSIKVTTYAFEELFSCCIWSQFQENWEQNIKSTPPIFVKHDNA